MLDASKVAAEAWLEVVYCAVLMLVIGFPPSEGNTMEPLALETILPKFMSRVLVIKIVLPRSN